MYTPIVRIILGIIALILAAYHYSNGRTVGVCICLLVVVLMISSYYRNGTVYIAYRQLKKEKYDRAEELLAKIEDPNLLSKNQKGYYHFIKGFIEFNKLNYDKSFDEFTLALESGVRTEHNDAIVCLNLTAIELNRGNLSEAKRYFKMIKTLKYKPGLEYDIKKMQESISSQSH